MAGWILMVAESYIYLHVLTISHTPFPLRVLTLPLPHQSLYLCCKMITIILNTNFRNLSEYEIIIPWVFWFCRELFGFAVSCLVLPWAFGFAVSFLVLLWAVWFCREHFGFDVSILVLTWAFWFCREHFGFAVSILVLPSEFWLCSEHFVSAVSILVLPWAFWFYCRESIGLMRLNLANLC